MNRYCYLFIIFIITVPEAAEESLLIFPETQSYDFDPFSRESVATATSVAPSMFHGTGDNLVQHLQQQQQQQMLFQGQHAQVTPNRGHRRIVSDTSTLQSAHLQNINSPYRYVYCLSFIMFDAKAKALHHPYFSPRVALPVLRVAALQSEQVRRERVCTSSKPSVNTTVNLFHSHAPTYCCCCCCCYCEVCHSVAVLFLVSDQSSCSVLKSDQSDAVVAGVWSRPAGTRLQKTLLVNYRRTPSSDASLIASTSNLRVLVQVHLTLP
jgi:hypothetical protein